MGGGTGARRSDPVPVVRGDRRLWLDPRACHTGRVRDGRDAGGGHVLMRPSLRSVTPGCVTRRAEARKAGVRRGSPPSSAEMLRWTTQPREDIGVCLR